MDTIFKIMLEQGLHKNHFTQNHISWHLRTISIHDNQRY